MIVTPVELSKSFFTSPWITWNLRRHFKALLKDFDVRALYCLSLNEKLFLTPTALEHNVPVTWAEHQEIRGWLMKSPWRKRYKQYSRHVQIVPISKKNRERLITTVGVAKENIRFVIHGVNTDMLPSDPRPTKKGLIVAASRFTEKKGIMDFVKAIQILKEKKPNLEINIIGEGSEDAKIRDYVKTNLADVSISVKPQMSKKAWYKIIGQADVYVSSAREAGDTFGLNAAEALAARCKLVVTHCSGITDYLTDGTEAFLCEPENPSDLSEKIQKALDAPETMRDKAREVALNSFDQKRMLKEYRNLILRTHEEA